MYKIKKYPVISKLSVIFYFLFSSENNINLEYIMKKTQEHINDRGIYFRNKIHKLYDMW